MESGCICVEIRVGSIRFWTQYHYSYQIDSKGKKQVDSEEDQMGNVQNDVLPRTVVSHGHPTTGDGGKIAVIEHREDRHVILSRAEIENSVKGISSGLARKPSSCF